MIDQKGVLAYSHLQNRPDPAGQVHGVVGRHSVYRNVGKRKYGAYGCDICRLYALGIWHSRHIFSSQIDCNLFLHTVTTLWHCVNGLPSVGRKTNGFLSPAPLACIDYDYGKCSRSLWSFVRPLANLLALRCSRLIRLTAIPSTVSIMRAA